MLSSTPSCTAAGGLAQGNTLFNKYLLPTRHYAKQSGGGATGVTMIDSGPALAGAYLLVFGALTSWHPVSVDGENTP